MSNKSPMKYLISTLFALQLAVLNHGMASSFMPSLNVVHSPSHNKHMLSSSSVLFMNNSQAASIGEDGESHLEEATVVDDGEQEYGYYSTPVLNPSSPIRNDLNANLNARVLDLEATANEYPAEALGNRIKAIETKMEEAGKTFATNFQEIDQTFVKMESEQMEQKHKMQGEMRALDQSLNEEMGRLQQSYQRRCDQLDKELRKRIDEVEGEIGVFDKKIADELELFETKLQVELTVIDEKFDRRFEIIQESMKRRYQDLEGEMVKRGDDLRKEMRERDDRLSRELLDRDDRLFSALQHRDEKSLERDKKMNKTYGTVGAKVNLLAAALAGRWAFLRWFTK